MKIMNKEPTATDRNNFRLNSFALDEQQQKQKWNKKVYVSINDFI